MQPPDWGDILVALGLGWAAFSWWVQRERDRKQREEELQWRRTELLFSQASLFDGDNEVSEAVKLLTANNTELSVDALLNSQSDVPAKVRGEGRHRLDKLLNFMDRIAYAGKKRVLTMEEVAYFEWYFLQIKAIDSLNTYCENHYPDILEIAAALDNART